ncbi:Transcriptional regulator PadR-like family protein [compost metagenome]
MMEYAALGFLMYRPLSMYDLSKAMERSTQHFLSASFGSLHPTLRKLEAQGHVTGVEDASTGRRKKIYHLTETGRTHFITWLSQAITAERVSDPSLLRLFFLAHLDPQARATVMDQFLGEMQQAAEQLEALHASLQGMQVPPGFDDHWAYQLATLEFGIAHHRFVKDWYQAKRDALAGPRG